MKKTNLIKVISILLISAMLMLFATTVNAADDNSYNDLTSTLTGNTSNNTSNTSNTNTNSNSSNNTSNTNSANNTNKALNMSNNTSNSSVYNNTNLPKTGATDSIPVAMLVVVFGISAVYAFKKVRDYKNI